MKKRIFLSAVLCVFIGVLLVHCHSRTLSSNEAAEILEAYLTRLGEMEHEAEEELELEFTPPIHEFKIEGKPAYYFTLWMRYKNWEGVRAGEVSRDSYWAITKDGSKIYEMDLATGEWIEGYVDDQ